MLRGPRRTRIHRPVIPVQRGGIILDLSLRVLRGHLNASALQLCAVFVLCFVAACAPRVERGQAAVAMPDAFSADVAEQVLAAGGNAVDATVAAAFALAVTYPEAGNIGGGGFMTLQFDGRPAFLDYRETAPATAYRDMYLDEDGNVIKDLSFVGHLAIGVPGTVAGLWAAHQKHGSLPWSDLIAPAVGFAKAGFVVSSHLAGRVSDDMPNFEGRTNFHDYFGGVAAGQRFIQPELAATLERIAADGPDDFYTGKTSQLIVDEMQRGQGLVSADDLAGYETAWRAPIVVDWRGYQVISAPLPSSGGFGVAQLLKMKDYLATEFEGQEHNSVRYVHLIAEIEKRVFADRAEYLGDPDFVEADMARLVSDAYVNRRAEEVQLESISRLADVRPGTRESANTTHFSIVDKWGNAVANSYTLNGWFGSGVVVEGGGFLLNNEMDDFSAKPGVPNYYGVVGDSANAIEPGKRMLSSMSPTILLRDGKSVMVLGTPGGSTIFTSVFQAIVNIIDFDMSPAQAVAATRFHHQLLPPEKVTYSPCCPLPDATIDGLRKMGYEPVPHRYEFGDLQLIWFDGEGYQAASDPRHRGESRVIN